MKKTFSILLVFALLLSFAIFALGSSDEDTTSSNNNTEPEKNETVATVPPVVDNMLGEYRVTIDSCRLATNYSGEDIVIVKYLFENVKDEDNSSFMWSVNDEVYQNGVSLKTAYAVSDDYNYDSSNKSKDIKIGVTLEVEVAYILNDNVSPIEVEASEYLGFNDKKITKTFDLPQQ